MQEKTYSIPKRMVLALLMNLLAVGLLLLPAAIYTAYWLTDVDIVKTQLKESKVYDIGSAELARQIITQIPADESASYAPGLIQESIGEVITPVSLQSKVEPLLEANYQWLAGERAEPLTEINFTNEQQMITERTAAKLADTYTQKPVCSSADFALYRSQLQFQPLQAPCRVEGVDVQRFMQTLQMPVNSEALTIDTSANQNSALTPPAPSQLPISINPEVWQGAFLALRYGVYVLLGLLCILMLLARLITGTWLSWLRLLRRPLLSTGIVLFASVVLGAVLTQTSWVQVATLPYEVRQSLSYLAKAPLVIGAFTAVSYITLAIFVILIGQRRKYQNVRSNAAREAAVPVPSIASAPSDSTSQPHQ